MNITIGISNFISYYYILGWEQKKSSAWIGGDKSRNIHPSIDLSKTLKQQSHNNTITTSTQGFCYLF